MLRIGILGASRVAPISILASAAQRRDVEVVAVASRDASRAETFAIRHGIACWYSNYSALIESPNIDLVYVGTHAPTHTALALDAIAARKPVLVEKPFATSAAAANEVAQAADRATVWVAEAMHSLHHLVFDRLLTAVRDRKIGSVHRITAVFEERTPNTPGEHRWRSEAGGGALLDVGVYLIAFARAIAGDEPIGAEGGATYHEGVDSSFWAQLNFGNGIRANIKGNIGAQLPTSILRIEGSDGLIERDNPLVPHKGYRLVIESAEGR